MTQIIKIKQSSTPGKIPLVSDLALGELAINTFDGKLYAVQNNGTPAVIDLTGSGGGGNVDEFQVAFHFTDSSVFALTTSPANKAVMDVQVSLFVPFDDLAATLSVGDSGDANRLVPTTSVDPSVAATFELHPLHTYGVPTPLYLFITPGTSSQGNGVVTIKFQQ